MNNNSENIPMRLLIVDDSRLIRRALSNIFEPLYYIKVVGEACNGKEALELIPRLNPDVVTLDIEMPVMDGLTALKHIMMLCPRPTVMLSTLTRDGAKATFDALKFGAIDFIHKPSRLSDLTVQKQNENIIRKITYAARVEISSVRYIRPTFAPAAKPSDWDVNAYDHLVVIGAAEGGYRDLLNIIPHLDAQLPITFMVMLYMASKSVDDFARYLNNCSAIRVKRLENGDVVRGGVCYMISDDQYVTIHEKKQGHIFNVNPSPFPYRRGIINMLMFSAAEFMRERAVGVILSGLGNDGAEGLREITRLGGTCFFQNPKTCLYKEMPEAALKVCAPDFIVSDREIAAKINSFRPSLPRIIKG
jgi:two-component system chemotaxis response regulator CheB